MLKSYEFEVIIRTHIVNSSISEETVYIQSRSFPANRLVKHMGHSVQKTNSKITNFEWLELTQGHFVCSDLILKRCWCRNLRITTCLITK